MLSRALLALLLFLPCSVQALFISSNETDFWAEFGNNFATDLAPIIALFGEQVTKQFLSESTTILDTIIFAVGPLGIITAIVSGIRVSGSSFLKSVIGRAREPHAVPEVELCSSTSESVCELWSNGGICRVFGRPRILEFIFREPKEDEYYARCNPNGHEEEAATCGIFLTREILRMALTSQRHPTTSKGEECAWRAISSLEVLVVPAWNFAHQTSTWMKTRIKSAFNTAATSYPGDIELGNLSQSSRREKASCEDKHGMTEFAPFPNLALNIGVQKAQTSILTLWLAAVFGLLVQSSFFGYTTWAMWYHPTFYEDEKASNAPLFFTFTIAGTASIIIGMGLCATLIDRNSKEQRLVLSPTNETGKPRLPEYRIFWLQPGGQRIGDQEFDAFACNEAKTEYIASWNDRKAPVPILLVWLGVSLSFVGWMVQFIGLRGQHATVSLYQLCCTITMSIVRASIRSSRSTPRNELKNAPEGTQGHELDWQAFQLISDLDQTAEEASSDQVDPRLLDKNWIRDTLKGQPYWIIQRSGLENIPSHDISVPFIEMRVEENVAVVLTEKGRGQEQNLIREIESCDSHFFVFARKQESNPNEILEKLGSGHVKSVPPNTAAKSMRIRARLAHLTKQLPYQAWEIDTRKTALHLKNALQKSSQLLYPTGAESLVWSTRCCSLGTKNRQSREMPICFCMVNTKAGWTIDGNQLEAVLGLWSWSLDKYLSVVGKDLRQLFQTQGRKRIVIHKEHAEDTCFILNQWGVPHAVLDRDNYVEDWRLINLSVPDMNVFGYEGNMSRALEPYKPKFRTALSIGTTNSLLQMMAQDLFTTFVETIGTLRLRRLDTVAISKLSGLETEETMAIEGMVQSLVSEGLATRNEAIMSVIPALYLRSGNSVRAETLNLVFAQAVLLKRREDFSESQKVVKTLAKLASPKIKARAFAFLCETYRSELCWMMHQHRAFSNRECRKRRMEILLDIHDFREVDDVERLQHIYISVIDWLLWANHASPTFVGDIPYYHKIKIQSVLGSIRPTLGTPTVLDKKTLDDLNLDGTESRRETFELALTLDQRFNLGESSVPVRKQLLRWAIESDCTGLVEDLWFAERNNPWAESAFSTGSDELFWAASLRSDSHDMINTIMFLLEVVEMNQSASLECRGELHQSWWETSPKRDLIRVKYEQVSNVLAAAIICHNGLDVVELLVYDLDRRDRLNPKYVCEAIESALEHGSLETFTCLITNAVQWRFSYSLNFGLLPILAEWGLEQQTEARLQSDGGELFGKEFLGSLLEIARIKLQSEKEERAKKVFKADRDGLVALLEEAQRKWIR